MVRRSRRSARAGPDRSAGNDLGPPDPRPGPPTGLTRELRCSGVCETHPKRSHTRLTRFWGRLSPAQPGTTAFSAAFPKAGDVRLTRADREAPVDPSAISLGPPPAECPWVSPLVRPIAAIYRAGAAPADPGPLGARGCRPVRTPNGIPPSGTQSGAARLRRLQPEPPPQLAGAPRCWPLWRLCHRWPQAAARRLVPRRGADTLNGAANPWGDLSGSAGRGGHLRRRRPGNGVLPWFDF